MTTLRGLLPKQVGGGPGTLSLPDDAGDIGFQNLLEAEGEGGGRTGEIAFGDGEDAPVGTGGIGD